MCMYKIGKAKARELREETDKLISLIIIYSLSIKSSISI